MRLKREPQDMLVLDVGGGKGRGSFAVKKTGETKIRFKLSFIEYELT